MPLEVILERTGITPSTRLSDAVEGAAYFLVSEALANTLKYAEASRACVRLDCSHGRLAIDVSDNGRGFDAERVRLRGLRGLADRIEALGGTLRVRSTPGGGTRVLATLPAREPKRT